MSYVIGFDFSAYKFGFGVGNLQTRKIELFGKVEIGTETALSEEDRADVLTDRALEMIKKFQPKSVAFEDNRISFGGNNKHLQEYFSHGNLRILARYCKKKGIKVSWRGRGKMYVAVLGVGQGKAPKADLIKHFQDCGYAVKNDDQADGCGHAWAEMKALGCI